MTACPVCLESASAPHPICLIDLFGEPRVPVIDLELAKLHTSGLAMVGRASLPGVQRKLSVSLSDDPTPALTVATERGSFILKPQSQTFPAIPENEHVTLRIAAAAGVEVPHAGLFALRDRSPALVVRRFDRAGSRRVPLEDFCQLSRRSPKEKYEASAEECFRLVKRFASEPGPEALRLYRRLLVVWWTGNGDMHLKNFSLLTGGDGRVRLSPAYDLVCTRLVIPGDPLALPVAGKKDRITKKTWLELAKWASIAAPLAEREITAVTSALPKAEALLGRSSLSEEMRDAYRDLLRGRAGILAGPRRR